MEFDRINSLSLILGWYEEEGIRLFSENIGSLINVIRSLVIYVVGYYMSNL